MTSIRIDRAARIQLAFFAVALSALALFWWDGAELGSLALWLGCFFFTVHALWAMWSWYALTGRAGDGYFSFAAALLLFSGGQVILWTLQLLPDGILGNFGYISSRTIQRTILVVNASVTAFHLGALMRVPERHPLTQLPEEPPWDVRRLRRIGVAFVAIGLPSTLVAMYEAVLLVFSGGYMALFQQDIRIGADNWAQSLSVFLTPGLLIMLATAPERRLNVWVVWLVGSAKVATNLFLGSRSNAVLSLVPLMMVQHAYVRPISRRLVLAALVGGVVILPWIASVRTLDVDARLASGGDAEERRHPVVSLLAEMGGSMVTVAHTIDLVPLRRDYEYGAGYGRAALTVLPNVFGGIHPAYSKGSYSAWLVDEVDPTMAAFGGGLGFSMLAEGFVNFGPFGTVVVMFASGYALAAFINWARRHRYGVVFEAIALSVLLFFPRSESNGATIRTLVWCVAIPLLLVRTRRAPTNAQADRSPAAST